MNCTQRIEKLVVQFRERIQERGALTTGEAAAVLGISEATVKRWSDRGKLRVKLLESSGHRRLFLDSVCAAADILDMQRAKARAEAETLA